MLTFILEVGSFTVHAVCVDNTMKLVLQHGLARVSLVHVQQHVCVHIMYAAHVDIS